jgi:hypothetical protein
LLRQSHLVQFLVRAGLCEDICGFNGSVNLGTGDKTARVVANDQLGAFLPLSLVAELVLHCVGFVVTGLTLELVGFERDFLLHAFGGVPRLSESKGS